MTNSRQKGKRGERSLVHELFKWLGARVTRTAQNKGKNGGEPDLEGWPGVWIEGKWYKSFGFLRHLRQAEADAEAKGNGDLPVLFLREDGDTEWVLCLRLRHVVRFCKLVAAVGGKPIMPEEKKGAA